MLSARMTAPNSNQISILKVLLHAGFFISGVSTVLIGQVLPILSKKFELDDAGSGNFFPAQFAGSLIGTFLTNHFGKRHKFLAASAFGCLLMSVGVFLLNFDRLEICLFGFFVNGLGIGLTLPSINMLILELNPQRAASSLSVLNFFWGFGAILSQPFVDLFSRGTSIWTPTVALSVALFIIGTVLFLSPKNIETKPPAVNDTNDVPPMPIWTNPIAWLIAGFNFIHVGFESAMGGWLKTYTQRINADETINLIQPITLYFFFFVAGRGVAPLFFKFLDDNKMLLSGLLTVLLGMIILLSAKDVLTLGFGAAVAGFGTSAVFPTNMSRFTKTFGPTASRRAMPFFICGTLGAASTTWFIGFMSSRFNDLRSGMFILLGSIAVLIVLQIFLQLQTKRL